MNRKLKGILSSILGGLILLVSINIISDSNNLISGLLLGFGVSTLLYGILTFIRSYTVSNEEFQRNLKLEKIENEDERNILIKEKSNSKVSEIMTYIQIAFIVFLLSTNADQTIILTASGILLLKGILLIIYSNNYSKRM